MLPDWSIILAIVSALTAFYAAMTARKESDAKAEASVSGAALELVQALKVEMAEVKVDNSKMKGEMDTLRDRVACLESEREELLAGITMLCHQLESVGHRPVWRPRTKKKEVRASEAG